MSNSLQKILVVQSDTRRATFARLFDLKRARVAEAVAEHHVQKRLGYFRCQASLRHFKVGIRESWSTSSGDRQTGVEFQS